MSNKFSYFNTTATPNKFDIKVIAISDVDGLQNALDNIDLPSGTENQTLRHNGTGWEATNKLKLKEDSINNSYGYYIEYGTKLLDFRTHSDGYSRLLIDHGSGKRAYMVINSGNYPSLALENGSGYELQLFASNVATQYCIKAIYNQQTTFQVLQNGTISSKTLSGTTNRPLYANASGEIKAADGIAPIIKVKNLNSSNPVSEIVFTNTELGITTDLRDLPIQMQLWYFLDNVWHNYTETGLEYRIEQTQLVADLTTTEPEGNFRLVVTIGI